MNDKELLAIICAIVSNGPRISTVLLDKPTLLLVPKSRINAVNGNLKKLAVAIEIFDDTLPEPDMQEDLKAATMRLMAIIQP
jgi:hypothetical protein